MLFIDLIVIVIVVMAMDILGSFNTAVKAWTTGTTRDTIIVIVRWRWKSGVIRYGMMIILVLLSAIWMINLLLLVLLSFG